jgi:hypothetical protein
MRKLSLGDTIPQSADAAWAVIGDFSGMKKWAPIVESESTEDTPKGKVRTLTLGGRTVVELMVDHGPHHYTYTLDRPDMKIYRSTVSVSPQDEGAMIVLTVEFEPVEGGDVTASTEGFMKFLGGNLKAMKRAVATA